MLIEVPYKTGDTVSLKLISGDEVIGRLDSNENETYTLIKPMTFMMGPQGLGLVPFMFSTNEATKVAIPAKFVMVITKTDQNVAKQYINQTTGLHI
jgi:hypothetical protein